MVRKQTNAKRSIRRDATKGAVKPKRASHAKVVRADANGDAKKKFGRRAKKDDAASHRGPKKNGGPLEFLRRLNPF
jgi:hypothetical protein